MDEDFIPRIIRDLKKPLLLIVVLLFVVLWINISNKLQYYDRKIEQEIVEKHIVNTQQIQKKETEFTTTYPVKTEPSKKEQAKKDTLARTITGEDWFGFAKKEDFDKITEYANSGDKEAWALAMTRGALDGTIIKLKNGEAIFIKDVEMLSGVVKIRRKGDTKEYYTNYEAIQENK